MNYWKETRPTRSKEDTIGQHSHVADDDDGDNDDDDNGDDDDGDDDDNDEDNISTLVTFYNI